MPLQDPITLPYGQPSLRTATWLPPRLAIFLPASWIRRPASHLLVLALFLVYHPLQAVTVNRAQGWPTFADARFLVMAGVLGIVVDFVYQKTGSVWPPVVVHWLTVVAWLLVGGGVARLGV